MKFEYSSNDHDFIISYDSLTNLQINGQMEVYTIPMVVYSIFIQLISNELEALECNDDKFKIK